MNPLPYETSGNPNSDILLVFFHGFPDTTQLWDGIIPPLQNDTYILNISYPNYSSKEIQPWGVDFPEIVSRIKLTIDHVNTSKRKVVVCAHDWGCIFTYLFDITFPNYITDMVMIDISPWISPTFGMFSYQFTLAVAFLIGGRIGNDITHRVVSFFGHNPPYKDKINSSMNYPYYYMFKNQLMSAFKLQKSPLAEYFPSCSIAYIYGKKKSAHFHTEKWLSKVRESPENYTEGMNCGHWVMLEEPKFLIDLMKKRLFLVLSKTRLEESKFFIDLIKKRLRFVLSKVKW